MPSADDQGLLRGVSEDKAAITPAAWSEPAILGVVAAEPPVAAIFVGPRAAGLAGATAPKDDNGGRSHRLPNIKEFVAGGDQSAFTWRFESVFRSVQWKEAEALDALPTLLDDVSLAVFRSIPADKQKTLKDAFAEMAEV
ncbi:unnamed protein product [Lampetra fluviatilis]